MNPRNPLLLPQEIAVLQGFADGETSQQIASRIGRTENAVRAIAGRAVKRLNASNRTHAVAAAMRWELVE